MQGTSPIASFDWSRRHRWSCDIDGVLTAYPRVWLDFIERNTGLRFASRADARHALGRDYVALKHAYRLSDDKYTVPLNSDIRPLLDMIRKRGESLRIFTTRPFDQYPVMRDRTVQWLCDTGCTFDGVFSKTVAGITGNGCTVHIDDDEAFFPALAREGVHCVLYTRNRDSHIQDTTSCGQITDSLTVFAAWQQVQS